jgi:hypothetical protein
MGVGGSHKAVSFLQGSTKALTLRTANICSVQGWTKVMQIFYKIFGGW